MPFGLIVAEWERRKERNPDSGPIHRFEGAFAPNHSVSPTVASMLMLCWISGLVLAWQAFQSGIFPTPVEVAVAFPRLWDDGLGDQLWSSFALNLEAVSIMFVLSLAIAYATVMPVFRPLATIVSLGRFNGFVGLPLIFMSLLHEPHAVKVALLVFGAGVFTVLSLTKMIDGIPKELFDHSRTLRMSEWRVVWEVVILGRFDEVIEIFRINIAMMWMMLPMVEGRFKFEGGVGALMENEAKHLNLDTVFCVLFVVLAIGFFQDYVIAVLKRIICPYAEIGMERR